MINPDHQKAIDQLRRIRPHLFDMLMGRPPELPRLKSLLRECDLIIEDYENNLRKAQTNGTTTSH